MIQFSLQSHENNEVDRPWYDTTEGISSALKSLAGLNQLVAERHSAGYDRGERLNQFYVLNGRYRLDTCGNCCSVRGIPKEISHTEIPLVLTDEAFFGFLWERTGEERMISSSMDGGNLPLPNLSCSLCGEDWTIDNCHDVVVYHTTEVFSLSDFVGKTLEEVKLSYGKKSDAIYRMQPDILIRNDKHIDLDPEPEYPTLKKNEFGWLRDRDGITDAYVIQAGDDGFFNVWKYYHSECNTKNNAEREERSFREIFEKAGFIVNDMKAISNEYWNWEKAAPWFMVETGWGNFKIGWRKRVIQLEWEGVQTQLLVHRSSGKKRNIGKLFVEENVTKGPGLIHAWGLDDAECYLSRIRKHLSAN